MSKNRLEAFSDGVIAILITIMVLELRAPEQPTWAALRPVLPVFLGYVLSFIFLGIYWNNHHHLIQASHVVNGAVLWANLHLLFWLSLVPFATAWIGETHFAARPMAVYGAVLLLAAIAYTILTLLLIRLNGPESLVARAAGPNAKGYASIVCYAAAIPLAFVHPALSGALYIFVALLWLIPDRRLERARA